MSTETTPYEAVELPAERFPDINRLRATVAERDELRDQVLELTADRDSWLQQADDRAGMLVDAGRERDRLRVELAEAQADAEAAGRETTRVRQEAVEEANALRARVARLEAALRGLLAEHGKVGPADNRNPLERVLDQDRVLKAARAALEDR